MTSSFLDATDIRASDQRAWDALTRAMMSDTVQLSVNMGPSMHSPGGRASDTSYVMPLWLARLQDQVEPLSWAVAFHLQEERERHTGAADYPWTYGEASLAPFYRLLDAVCGRIGGTQEKTFMDIGSGSGRLVLAAAARHAWRRCVGIEGLPELHAIAMESLAYAVPSAAEAGAHLSPCELWQLEVAPCNVRCQALLAEVDVVFAYTTTWDAAALGTTLASGLKSGALVVTIDSCIVRSEADEGEQARDTVSKDSAPFELLWREDVNAMGATEDPKLEDITTLNTAYVWRRV